jgi:hypothetical protein
LFLLCVSTGCVSSARGLTLVDWVCNRNGVAVVSGPVVCSRALASCHFLALILLTGSLFMMTNATSRLGAHPCPITCCCSCLMYFCCELLTIDSSLSAASIACWLLAYCRPTRASCTQYIEDLRDAGSGETGPTQPAAASSVSDASLAVEVAAATPEVLLAIRQVEFVMHLSLTFWLKFLVVCSSSSRTSSGLTPCTLALLVQR